MARAPAKSTTIERQVALLRAVNVGGRKLLMSDLVKAAAAAGFADAKTYIQSGNLVFTPPPKVSQATLAERLSAAIRELTGLDVAVVMRSASELRACLAANPYLAREPGLDPKTCYVSFAAAAPTAAALAKCDRAKWAPDTFEAVGRDLYLGYVAGAGRSKMTTTALDKALGVVSTARNWNTINKLADMADAVASDG